MRFLSFRLLLLLLFPLLVHRKSEPGGYCDHTPEGDTDDGTPPGTLFGRERFVRANDNAELAVVGIVSLPVR